MNKKTKKIVKGTAIIAGAAVLIGVSYMVGYHRANDELIKLVETGEDIYVQFKKLTGEIVPVYMRYEA